MSYSKTLYLANLGMGLTLTVFLVAVYFSYFREAQLSMQLNIALHILQIVLAGFFKLFYVLRLFSQRALGLTVK